MRFNYNIAFFYLDRLLRIPFVKVAIGVTILRVLARCPKSRVTSASYYTLSFLNGLLFVHDSLRCLTVPLLSRLFDRFITRTSVSQRRTMFRNTPVNLRSPLSSNPHGVSASHRSTGDDIIQSFALKNGLTLFSVGASPKDGYNSVSGNSAYFFEKDLRKSSQYDSIPDSACIKMVDVDYYLTASQLADYGHRSECMLFYTMIPESLATQTDESLTTVSADGKITQKHHGSTAYTHYLWDWSVDYVTLINWRYYLFPCITHYYVETIRVAESRFVVGLFPCLRGGPIATYIYYLMGDLRPLTRWRPTHCNGVNYMCGPKNVTISFADSGVQSVITRDQFLELLHVPRVTAPSTQRITGKETTSYALTAAMSLIRDAPVDYAPRTFDTTPRSYKPEYSDIEENEYKTPGRQMFPPLVDGTFVPARSLASDVQCVHDRLDRLQTKKTISAKYTSAARLFIDVLSSLTPEKAHPDPVETVIDESLATQKNKYSNALVEDDPDASIYKAFQKAEAYGDIKPPRNISAVAPLHVVQFSTFIRPFVRFLKEKIHWYSFGKTPSELADQVAEIMSANHGVLVEGDFSRYDGTQWTFCVDLCTSALLAFYHPKYHEEILTLKAKLSYSTFMTCFGLKYCTYDTMKSGSANTSCDNTLFHAFCQFAHLYTSGFSAKEAWNLIGLCAGDDGLLRTTDPSGYEKTCSDLGMVLKCTVRQPGDPVGFLGRIWPHWDSNQSFFDPMRCLSKFHYSDTSDPKIDSEILAWRKAAGYYVTDKGNFIGHIARHTLQLTGAGSTEIVERREWLAHVLPANVKMSSSQLFETVQTAVYPTFHSDPFTLLLADGSLDPCYSYFLTQVEMYGVTPNDVKQWYLSLLEVRNINNFPTLLTIPPSIPTVATSVDGVVLGPEMQPAPKLQEVNRPLCYQLYTRRKCSLKKCNFYHGEFCRDFLSDKGCSRSKCKFTHCALSTKC